MKKILFVSSEAVPYVKTGGLADVVGSLPKYFDKKEYDVRSPCCPLGQQGDPLVYKGN